MLDMLAERTEFEYGEIARLERMKTGALIAFCCRAGALLGGAAADAERALTAYAQDLGFAFQIADDLIDADGSEEEAGKACARTPGRARPRSSRFSASRRRGRGRRF